MKVSIDKVMWKNQKHLKVFAIISFQQCPVLDFNSHVSHKHVCYPFSLVTVNPLSQLLSLPHYMYRTSLRLLLHIFIKFSSSTQFSHFQFDCHIVFSSVICCSVLVTFVPGMLLHFPICSQIVIMSYFVLWYFYLFPLYTFA